MINIVTRYGDVVFVVMTLREACQLRRDLYEQDRRDGTYEPGYYRIVRAEEARA